MANCSLYAPNSVARSEVGISFSYRWVLGTWLDSSLRRRTVQRLATPPPRQHLANVDTKQVKAKLLTALAVVILAGCGTVKADLPNVSAPKSVELTDRTTSTTARSSTPTTAPSNDPLARRLLLSAADLGSGWQTGEMQDTTTSEETQTRLNACIGEGPEAELLDAAISSPLLVDPENGVYIVSSVDTYKAEVLAEADVRGSGNASNFTCLENALAASLKSEELTDDPDAAATVVIDKAATARLANEFSVRIHVNVDSNDARYEYYNYILGYSSGKYVASVSVQSDRSEPLDNSTLSAVFNALKARQTGGRATA